MPPKVVNKSRTKNVSSAGTNRAVNDGDPLLFWGNPDGTVKSIPSYNGADHE